MKKGRVMVKDQAKPKDKEVNEDTEIKPKERPVAKKRSREDRIEKTMDSVVKGITKALSSSEERFLDLEGKRLKLDEMMIKMENERIK